MKLGLSFLKRINWIECGLGAIWSKEEGRDRMMEYGAYKFVLFIKYY
jgi:hypothetical protein